MNGMNGKNRLATAQTATGPCSLTGKKTQVLVVAMGCQIVPSLVLILHSLLVIERTEIIEGERVSCIRELSDKLSQMPRRDLTSAVRALYQRTKFLQV